MFAVNNISVVFSGETLFDELSVVIGPKERIGLTGKNGAGKTTLLKILNGNTEPTSGSVNIPQDKTIGYLPQQMKYPSGRTVFAEAREAFADVLALRSEEQEIINQITERTDYQTESYLKLSDRLSEVQQRLEMFSADKMAANIEKILKGLGFERSDFERPVTEFSGGWRMRIELAKILLKQPDLLLLDEPTNHLDIESVQWLESFLKNYGGAIVLISHDRAFLDAITERTIEIAGGNLYDYNLPFSKFEEKRKERIEKQKAEFINQQKYIDDTQAFIDRFRYQANKASQVQSRVKQLEKLERIDFDAEDFSDLEFSFPPAPPSGDVVFEAKELGKSYGELEVLKDLYFDIENGDRIAFAGKNGQGKTTMIRIIIGELEYSGTAKLGHNVKIGYFAQNQDEKLDDSKTVLDVLDDVAVGDVRKRLRDILGQFLFHGDDVHKKVSVLSGGERSRLALAKLMLEPHNLLILDEPTNHLDIRSKDRLKKALQQFTGTLIVVSHDRHFLDGLVDNIFEFENKKIKKHGGDVSLFLKKIQEKQTAYDFKNNNSQKNAEAANESEKITDNKQLYLLRKEYDKEIRKLQKEVEKHEKHIEEKEQFIDEAEKRLASGEQIDDTNFFEEFEAAKKALEFHLDAWEKHEKLVQNMTEEKEREAGK
jgi:ATP-binding cassette, subfamily F, member 3